MYYAEETNQGKSSKTQTNINKGEFSIVLNECPMKYRLARAAFEAEFIRVKLSKYAGNVSRTARSLGIARKTLALKIERYGINIKALRSVSPDSYMEVPLIPIKASVSLAELSEDFR